MDKSWSNAHLGGSQLRMSAGLFVSPKFCMPFAQQLELNEKTSLEEVAIEEW
jgi:hypothetical protein